MSRYLGPRIKIIRKLGKLPGFTKKKISKKKLKLPGQHGKYYLNFLKTKVLISHYKKILIEKQKISFNYGLTKNELLNYYKILKKKKKLLNLLEFRLDCIVFKLGFSGSISQGRQMIRHKHISINSKISKFPKRNCKKKDRIFFNKKKKIFIPKILKRSEKKEKLNRYPSNFLKNYSVTKKILSKYFIIKKFKVNIRKKNFKNEYLIHINYLRILQFFSKF
jgi:ribosomal protein S4